MSLMDLLDRSLEAIIGYLYERQSRLPHTFAPDCASLGYNDLLSLSLTLCAAPEAMWSVSLPV